MTSHARVGDGYLDPGFFITLEGPEGSGKTTQVQHLAEQLAHSGYRVTTTREPGGTPAGERIRRVLLDASSGRLRPETEAFLVNAARSELVTAVIRPALESGGVVLCDRFTDATLAYQGYGGGVPLAVLAQLNALATGGLTPDLTLLFDLPVEVGLARRQGADIEWTRLDAAGTAFHERVRDGYRALARENPERWAVIDAERDPEAVTSAVRDVVYQRLHQTIRPTA